MRIYHITSRAVPKQHEPNDLDLQLQALGTQVKPIITLVEGYPEPERAKHYATAINTLAGMTGETGSALAKIRLGIAVAMQRAGATKSSVVKALDTAIGA